MDTVIAPELRVRDTLLLMGFIDVHPGSNNLWRLYHEATGLSVVIHWDKPDTRNTFKLMWPSDSPKWKTARTNDPDELLTIVSEEIYGQ